MPHYEDSTYRPPIWLRNGHANTFYTYLFRNPAKPPFVRQRIETPDHDYYDVDHLKAGPSNKLCILLHGLEGSSSSQYILGTSQMFSENGFHVSAINFRSCSGTLNLGPVMYHSGFSEDLHHFIGLVEQDYDHVYICGFSLGANVTFKYAGDSVFRLSPKIKAIAGVSVPCDLKAGSYQIMLWQNRLYESRFLKSLKAKIIAKDRLFPGIAEPRILDLVKTLRDFDDKFTAPLHGFKDADDYYDSCNCKQFLHQINLPALMINAWDDSFLPRASYPIDEARANKNLHLVTTKYGGHVGFTTFGSDYFWYESAILRFFLSEGVY